jgi:biopolymer transport protein ExbD
MKFPRNARMFAGHLDAAPIACVLFCLLIFLLLALVVPVPGIPIRLPAALSGRANGVTGAQGAKVTVGIGAGTAQNPGALYFQQQIMNDGEFKRRLKEAVRKSPEPLTLIIQADANAPSGRTYQIEQLAAEAGITNALLALQPGLFGSGGGNGRP